MPRAVMLVTLVSAVLGAHLAGATEPDRIERSIVHIVNFSQRADWFSPWDMSQVAEGSGSGFVIEGGLIMTNAHVISDSRLLLVRTHNDTEQHVAEIVHVAHDCDLAVIRPENPAVLDGIPRLKFGTLPRLGSTVDTLGYPAGGVQVSSTRGVVSRIEAGLYVHSGKDGHISVQTDAAINPGNSGGPVFQDGRVVGVAFQVNTELENVGFFIPPEVIQRFLHDIEDGHYDGYPELGVQEVGMENPAARRHAGLGPDESGVRVDRVFPGTSAVGHIRSGDVILSVDGQVVGNDGSVADGDRRTQFGMLIDRKQVGDAVLIRLLRDGKRLEAEIPLHQWPQADAQGHLYDQRPRYYVYGGLVFVALNREMMKTYGSDWRYEASKQLLHEYFVRPLEEPEILLQERVVLLRRLTHPVNADITWYRNEVVERVNGRSITSLDVLVDTFENHDGEHHFIEFANHRRVGVLHRLKAEAANDEILERYGIDEDRNL